MNAQVWSRVEQRYIHLIAQAQKDARAFTSQIRVRLTEGQVWSNEGVRMFMARHDGATGTGTGILIAADAEQSGAFTFAFEDRPEQILVRVASHAALVSACDPLSDYAYWLPSMTTSRDTETRLVSWVDIEPELAQAIADVQRKPADAVAAASANATSIRTNGTANENNTDEAPKPNPFHRAPRTISSASAASSSISTASHHSFATQRPFARFLGSLHDDADGED